MKTMNEVREERKNRVSRTAQLRDLNNNYDEKFAALLRQDALTYWASFVLDLNWYAVSTRRQAVSRTAQRSACRALAAKEHYRNHLVEMKLKRKHGQGIVLPLP